MLQALHENAAGERSRAYRAGVPCASPAFELRGNRRRAGSNHPFDCCFARVPTLLMSGGLSPYVAQRTVARLAGLIAGAHARHFPDAGHMLPKTHRDVVNAEIIRHIQRADRSAAAGPPLRARGACGGQHQAILSE